MILSFSASVSLTQPHSLERSCVCPAHVEPRQLGCALATRYLDYFVRAVAKGFGPTWGCGGISDEEVCFLAVLRSGCRFVQRIVGPHQENLGISDKQADVVWHQTGVYMLSTTRSFNECVTHMECGLVGLWIRKKVVEAGSFNNRSNIPCMMCTRFCRSRQWLVAFHLHKSICR